MHTQKNKTSLKLESLAMAMAVVMVGAGPPKKVSPGVGSNDKLSFYVWMATAMARAKIQLFNHEGCQVPV